MCTVTVIRRLKQLYEDLDNQGVNYNSLHTKG